MMKTLVVMLILINGFLYSANSMVNSVKVSGLKKTREKIFFKMVGVVRGDTWTEQLKGVILRRLNNSGAFSEVSLKTEATDDGVDLQFEVKEKWSLVGFPMASGGGGSQFGAMVMDTNFMGTQSMAGLMAGIRSGKPQIFGFYSNPLFLSWRNYIAVFGGYGGEEIGDFERNNWVLGFEVGHNFTEYFSLGGGMRFVNYNHDKDETIVPEDGKSYTFYVTSKFDTVDVNEDTFTGFMGEVTFEKNTWWSDFSYYKFFGKCSLFLEALGDHTFAIMATGGVSDAPYGQGFVIGGQGGDVALPVKGIDDNAYIASKLISGSLEYRVPFYKTKGFLFSLVGFYDFVHFSKENGIELEEGNFINTMGVAFRVYLRKVTIPAFQIFVSYNPDTKNVKTGFSIGMGFGG